MKECPNCHAQSPNAQFCQKCGSPMADVADKTDTPIIKNSKKKLYIGIGGVLAAVIAVVLVLIFVVLPQNRYDKATELFKNRAYTEAITALEKLPENYKDVKELYPYYCAYAAYADRDYLLAAQSFASIRGYEDAKEMTDESNYLYAQGLLDAGKYDDAYTAFEKLSGYKDSEEQLIECRYRQALDLMNTDGALAKEMFTKLGDYKDSAEKLTECDYYAAMNLLDNKAYGEAYSAFHLLGDYKDSQDMLLECRYRKAKDLLDEKDYDGALERFTAISEYKDSEEMLLDSNYQKGVDLLASNDLGGAYNAFALVAGYKDADSLQLECRYLKAQELFAAEDYAGAAERLEAVGAYKDAQTLLAECRYLKGQELFAAKDYAVAETWFTAAGDFKDSKDLLAQCAKLKINERDLYEAYLNEQIRSESGEITSVDYKKFFDFDGDGVLDLFYTVLTNYSVGPWCPSEFCTIIDGKVVSLLDWYGFNDGVYIKYSKSLSKHVLSYWSYHDDEKIYYYSMNNGELTLISFLRAEGLYFGELDKYFVDEKEVSEEVYYRTLENYTAPIDDYYKID